MDSVARCFVIVTFFRRRVIMQSPFFVSGLLTGNGMESEAIASREVFREDATLAGRCRCGVNAERTVVCPPAHHFPAPKGEEEVGTSKTWMVGFVAGTLPHSPTSLLYRRSQGAKRRAAGAVSGEAAAERPMEPERFAPPLASLRFPFSPDSIGLGAEACQTFLSGIPRSALSSAAESSRHRPGGSDPNRRVPRATRRKRVTRK